MELHKEFKSEKKTVSTTNSTASADSCDSYLRSAFGHRSIVFDVCRTISGLDFIYFHRRIICVVVVDDDAYLLVCYFF